MGNFFISYSRSDIPWATWIAWQLEERGYEVVLEAWDIRPGHNSVLEMNRAATEAERILVVLSSSFLESLYTQPEWATAFAADPKGEQRRLIPIRVQECQPQGLLASIAFIDLVGLEEIEARETLLEGLASSGKPLIAPGFPGAGKKGSEPAGRPDFPGGTMQPANPAVEQAGLRRAVPSIGSRPIAWKIPGLLGVCLAVLVVVGFILPWPDNYPPPHITEVDVSRPVDDSVNIQISFSVEQMPPNGKVLVQVGADREFQGLWIPTQPLDDWSIGGALVGAPVRPEPQGWIRLIVVDAQGKRVAASEPWQFDMPGKL